MPGSAILESALSAFEASISVLLTLSYGFASSYLSLLSPTTIHEISSICTRLFLPALYIIQIGPDLSLSQIKDLWICLVWALVSISLVFVIGWMGRRLLKTPAWVIPACGLCNANAMPLLLLGSLESTGLLERLVQDGETAKEALERGKEYVLLNALVQQTMAFLLGPPIIKLDKPDFKDPSERHPETLPSPSSHPRPSINEITQDSEHVGLLPSNVTEAGYGYGTVDRIDVPIRKLDAKLDSTPDLRWPRGLGWIGWIVGKVVKFANPPLVGALLALFIGVIPPLHSAFLSESGLFYPSITSSLKNIGQLFTALQMFVLGGQLYIHTMKHSKKSTEDQVAYVHGDDEEAEARADIRHPGGVEEEGKKNGWKTARNFAFVLTVRYIIMPVISGGFVWLTAGKGWYKDDPMLWFILIMAPCGPPALILASMAELTGVDQAEIAQLLVISYTTSPVIAFIVSGALEIVNSKQG